MRASIKLAAIICLSLPFASLAHAECYGDAAAAFGCSNSRSESATLEHFGDDRSQVIPEYGVAPRSITASDLFTPAETMAYYKRIYSGRQGYQWSQNAYRQTVNAAGKPLRMFRNLPFARPRF